MAQQTLNSTVKQLSRQAWPQDWLVRTGQDREVLNRWKLGINQNEFVTECLIQAEKSGM